MLNDSEESFIDETSGCDTDEVSFSDSEEERVNDLNDGFDNPTIGVVEEMLNDQLHKMDTGQNVPLDGGHLEENTEPDDGAHQEENNAANHPGQSEPVAKMYNDYGEGHGIEHEMDNEWESESLDSMSSDYDSDSEGEELGKEVPKKTKKKTKEAQKQVAPVL